jgi:hypothetical protein
VSRTRVAVSRDESYSILRGALCDGKQVGKQARDATKYSDDQPTNGAGNKTRKWRCARAQTLTQSPEVHASVC